MSSGVIYLRSHVDVSHREYYKDDEVQYVFWVPGGNVARLILCENEWKWVKPYETDEGKNDPPVQSGDAVCVVEISVNKYAFRQTHSIQNMNSTKAHEISRNNKATLTALKRKPSIPKTPDSCVSVCLGTRFPNAEIAFGIHSYVRTPRQSNENSHESWQWIGACLIRKIHAREYETLQQPIFMWSDARMNTEKSSEDSQFYHEEFAIVQNEWQNTRMECNFDELSACIDSCTRVVANEFLAMKNARKRKDFDESYDEDQWKTRMSTFNTHLEGLCFDPTNIKIPIEGKELIPPEFMGATAQAWYVYDKPVVDGKWLVARLDEAFWLHQYDKRNYVKDVQAIVQGKNPPAERKLLTDVVRIATMHSTSSPYTEDKRRFEDGTSKDSDTYTSGLTVPGDCEDGAYAAYMIYMSILFGTWTDLNAKDLANVKALQRLAAYLGMPVCITGTAASPKSTHKSKSAGTHAYGAVIPYHTFVCALFDEPEDQTQAMNIFKERFGFEAPSEDVVSLAMETTLFCTPLLAHHEHNMNEGSKEFDELRDFAVRVMNERSCLAKNFFYTFVLDEDHACHVLALKAFTTAHREMLYKNRMYDFKGRVKIMEKNDELGSEYNCAFAFYQNGVGVDRYELFHTKNPIWKLRAISMMTKKEWDSDARLMLNTRQPAVPLIARSWDPEKSLESNETNKEFIRLKGDAFHYNRHHLLMFVYDMSYVPGKDGRTTLQLVCEKYPTIVAHAYDKCVALVYEIPNDTWCTN